jgi:hypothetical protein
MEEVKEIMMTGILNWAETGLQSQMSQSRSNPSRNPVKPLWRMSISSIRVVVLFTFQHAQVNFMLFNQRRRLNLLCGGGLALANKAVIPKRRH